MQYLRSLLIRKSWKWNFDRNSSFFHPFRHLDLLTQLILEDNRIALRGVDVAPKSNDSILPRLEFLSLKGNHLDRIENSLFWELRNSNLKELNLNSCNLKSIGYSAFSPLPRLLYFLIQKPQAHKEMNSCPEMISYTSDHENRIKTKKYCT